jgi:YidC/Oxa1 family membrane protein insertase
MEMDKRTVLAIAISIGIIIVWNVIFPPDEQARLQKERELAELQAKQEQVIKAREAELKAEQLPVTALADTSVLNVKPKVVTISGDLVHRKLSNTKGVHFEEYLLQEYKSTNKFMRNDENKVSLLNSFQANGFSATLRFAAGDTINLRSLTFELVDSMQTAVSLRGTYTVEYRARVKGRSISQRYTFTENAYDYTVSYDFSALRGLLAENGIKFQWRNGLPYTEDNPFEDENMSLVLLGGEDEMHRFDTGDDEAESFTDTKFKHITVRSKYFVQSIMPQNFNVSSVTASQRGKKLKDYTIRRYYMEFTSSELNPEFKMYTGSYDRNELNKYEDVGLDDIFLSASGYENFFSIFSNPLHYILLWMNSFIGSFGWTIIIFTILLKIALYPLTKKSYKGMKAMSELQPRMAKLKEKHGGNQIEMQHAMRNLYAEAGVNPLAGCLPMLLQMPLLFSLFHVFRAAVELRGESFLWIQNFAAPDALPIGLDAIGFATINLLPILLAVSQILTSKQTMTDPNQKAMVYVMPLVMMFMFYNWNAALNFYYLLFNVFTSIQQKMIKGPEKEVKATKEIKVDGFEVNDKAKKALAAKNKKQMYKKKK